MSMRNAGFRRLPSPGLAGCLLAATIVWASAPSYAAETTRVQRIAAALNIPRRAWTICTVNEIGRAVEAGQIADVMAMADHALARCVGDEQVLRSKANELLGAAAAERLMERLRSEAHDALVGSARTLEAAKAGGDRVDPAWPRVLGPAH